MKLWPQKVETGVVSLDCCLRHNISDFSAVGVYAISAVNKDVVSGVNVINPSGNQDGTRGVPRGITVSPKDISYAFTNGLAERGVASEITTASRRPPLTSQSTVSSLWALPLTEAQNRLSFATSIAWVIFMELTRRP
jgi:hypothetical protein